SPKAVKILFRYLTLVSANAEIETEKLCRNDTRNTLNGIFPSNSWTTLAGIYCSTYSGCHKKSK
ncbi:MAG: hypothetical protein ACXACH_08230, partial [Candidatus Hermodarchaeia archaeon]